MYKKFELNLEGINLDKLIGLGGWNVGSEFRAIEYTTTINPFLLLKDRIKFDVFPSSHIVTALVYPGTYMHTDSFPTAMNIYLSVSDENDVTRFWNFKDGHHEPKVGMKTKKYDPDTLRETGNFIAKKHDCYLLSTGNIHSVTVSDPINPRYILRFMWNNHTFDEIKDTIEIL